MNAILMDGAAEPGESFATAVGNATKKLPFAHPLTRAKRRRGGSVELTGHTSRAPRQRAHSNQYNICNVRVFIFNLIVQSHYHGFPDLTVCYPPTSPLSS